MLIKTRSVQEGQELRERELQRSGSVQMKQIQKFSWADEEAKVKIYIDFAQFEGPIADDAVQVTFSDNSCDVTITDAKGIIN